MNVCRFVPRDERRARLGVHHTDTETVTVLDIDETTLEAALRRGYRWDDFEAADGRTYDRGAVDVLAPVAGPAHLLGVGLNHRGHTAEVGHDVPDEPVFFPKSTASITGPDSSIGDHERVTTPQYEAELAVIVGTSLRRASVDEADDAIFGYTVGNDVTAHDLQMRDISNSRPWFRSKCFETFTPLGPRVVPPSAIDRTNGTVRAYLNGEEVQTLDLGDRVFDGPEILAHISSYFTLQPGDVVLTGTADGHGPLTSGDTVRVTADGVGSLENTVE